VNNDSIPNQSRPTVSTVLLAGFAGGVVEMMWVAGYCALTPLRSSEVLHQISRSAGIHASNGVFASLSGIAIHLLLSVLLALAFALSVWRPLLRRSGVVGNVLASCAALGMIWTFNFLVVLPSLNPDFADLMPYGVTLTSKLLFGVAMGWVLYRAEHRRRDGVGPERSRRVAARAV
jgi:hypothetical protein